MTPDTYGYVNIYAYVFPSNVSLFSMMGMVHCTTTNDHTLPTANSRLHTALDPAGDTGQGRYADDLSFVQHATMRVMPGLLHQHSLMAYIRHLWPGARETPCSLHDLYKSTTFEPWP